MRNTFAISILGVLFVGCAYSILATPQRLSFDLPANEGWQVGFTQPMQHPDIDPSGGLVEYVRNGEKVENWTELVTLQTQFRAGELTGLETAQEVYRKLVEQRNQTCPGSTRWQVLEESRERVLYEWWAKPCLGFPDQHEVSLLVDGKRDRFRLAYTAKVTAMDTATRERWLGILREARVQDPVD